MRIITYLDHKLIADDEQLTNAYTQYIAFLGACYHEIDGGDYLNEDMFHHMFKYHLEDWLNDMLENDEYHIVFGKHDMKFDQYLIRTDG